MKTFLVSVNANGASGPSSRPSPDDLNPPKGVQYRTEECEFTDRLPASIARLTRIARPTSRVQIEPDRPKSLSLAIRIASASSSNGTTATTGPKISSRSTLSCGSVGARTVGGYQNPGPSGADPRKGTIESCGTYEATASRCFAVISGPISVFSSLGSATMTSSTADSKHAMNRSYADRSTR